MEMEMEMEMENNNTNKIKKLSHHYEQIINIIGRNHQDPHLAKTSERAAKSLLFFTKGYQQNPHEIANEALFPSKNKNMVVIKNISFYSLCQHHLIPFFGTCHVAYVPNEKVLGLSKIPRIIDIFARRLQIQENMTTEIAETLAQILNIEDVAVTIQAKHLCMSMRGVQKEDGVLETFSLNGCFQHAPFRNDFLNAIPKT